MSSFKFLDLTQGIWQYIHSYIVYIHSTSTHSHLPITVPSSRQNVSFPRIWQLAYICCYAMFFLLHLFAPQESGVVMLSASQKGPAGWWWWSLCLDVIGGPHYGLVNGHNRRNHCLISAWLLLDSFLPKLTRDVGVFLNFTIYWQAICSR